MQKGLIRLGALIVIILGLIVIGGGAYYVIHQKATLHSTQNLPEPPSMLSTTENATTSNPVSVQQKSNNVNQSAGTPGSTGTSSPFSGTRQVYFQGQGTPFYKDNMHVYSIFNGTTTLEGVDPTSFEVVAYNYSGGADVSEWIAKDKNQVFYVGDSSGTFAGADPETFVAVLPPDIDRVTVFFKDKNHIYTFGGRIFDADVNTFTSLGSGYYKDNLHYYTFTGILPVSDPSTFIVLSFGYAKDSLHVYESSQIKKYDPASFVVLDGMYVKDKNGVYFSNKVDTSGTVSGADPATFKPLPVSNYNGTFGGGDEFAEDANHVYFDLDALPNADPKTFVALNARYGRDAHTVYLMNKLVPGADPATFTVFNGSVWFGKDAKNVYTDTEVIVGADPTSFELCPELSCQLPDGTAYNASDKNHYYDYATIVQ